MTLAAIAGQVAALWRAALAESGVGADGIAPDGPGAMADLFELGATSLDAMVVAVRIEDAFGVRVPQDQMFVRRSVAEQAGLVAELLGRPTVAGVLLHGVRAATSGAAPPPLVLGLPGFMGHAAEVGLVAAHALTNCDVWAYDLNDLDGARTNIIENGTWMAYADAMAAELVAKQFRPAAMLGFSFGGYLAWLVDRLVVARGGPPARVVNLDSNVAHLAHDGWPAQVAPLLALAPPAEMLLVHRAAPGRFALPRQLADSWRAAGVRVATLPCGTVTHADMPHPALLAVAGPTLAGYIADGRAPEAREPLHVATPGGAVFRLLAADCPPTSGDVAPLLAALPQMGEPLARYCLLLLALASGDGGLARDCARAILALPPPHRDAVYALLVLAAQDGDTAGAADIAERWCATAPEDGWMRARAARGPEAPAAWSAAEGLVLGEPATLDFAAAIGR